MHKLVSITEMRAIEQAANASGLSYAQMMEHAGRSLFKAILAHSHKLDRSVIGLIGPGNNGGDALVTLRLLAKAGWKSVAIVVGKRAKMDKLISQAVKAGTKVIRSKKALDITLTKSAVVLDGLLGTGMRLPLRDPYAAILKQVDEAIAKRVVIPWVVAVDCPSGMDCESGQVASEALKADLTVTMAAVKLGMLTLPAHEYLGQIEVGNIGLPEDLAAWAAINTFVIDESSTRVALPERPAGAHKGTFGTALIVAGSQRFPGAALLSGEAAYRSGAGLVTIATPDTIQASLASRLREATWLPLPSEDGWISEAAAELVASNLNRVTAMLFGPGFGQETTTGKFLVSLLQNKLPPLVVDADGLKLLSNIKGWPDKLPPGTILTPHPGEMAILTGLTMDKIQAERIAITEKYASQWKHIVVLKGAFTVVASPDGRSAVLPLASPALARAGTGDVLAGLVTGLRAQGVAAFEAACGAVWLHGEAGLRAAARKGGTAGILAGDLISELPSLIGK